MDSSERRLDLDRRHDGLDVLVTLDDLVALDDLYALNDPVAHDGLNNLVELDDLDDLVSPDDLDDIVVAKKRNRRKVFLFHGLRLP